MPLHHAQGSLPGGADIEGADDAVDAGGGDDGVAVFVPIVCQGFGGWSSACVGVESRFLLRGVDWDADREVVRDGGGCAEVEESEVGV